MKRNVFKVSFFQILKPTIISYSINTVMLLYSPMHDNCTEVLHISYTMCTHGSPKIYTLSPQAFGLRASGAHIRQTTCAHGVTIKCNMGRSDLPNMYARA